MTTTILSYALPILFIGSALFALAVLALAWRTYGREIALLRAQLAASAEFREFEVRVATTQVREFSVPVRRNAVRVRSVGSQLRRVAGRRAVA